MTAVRALRSNPLAEGPALASAHLPAGRSPRGAFLRVARGAADLASSAALAAAVLLLAVGLAGAVETPAPRPPHSTDCPLPTADCRPKAPDRLTPDAARVVDGDTIVVAGETIRLLDIDAPELRGKCEAEKRLARAAAARLTELLAGRPWRIERIRRKDRWGRTLALITTDERGATVSIGAFLVSEGLARPWQGRRRPWCGQ